MPTSTAYPFTLATLTRLRACRLSSGVLIDGTGTPCRLYVVPTTANPGGEWGFSYTMTEGGPIDATSLSLMQADPHPNPLALCLVVDDAGAKSVVATVEEGPGGGPPDPGYVG